MRNQLLKHKELGFLTLASLFIGVTLLAFLTYSFRDIETDSVFLNFALTNHMILMILMVALSVAFGFVWSVILYKEIQYQSNTSKNMLDVVLKFLGTEERKILNFLVEGEGRSTQSDISRLPGLNKVRAHRCLNKMREKDILEIIPHGKVRIIKLKKDIFDTIRD